MGKIAVSLWITLVVCLVACGGESETVEETSLTEVVDTTESATNTSVPPYHNT